MLPTSDPSVSRTVKRSGLAGAASGYPSSIVTPGGELRGYDPYGSASPVWGSGAPGSPGQQIAAAAAPAGPSAPSSPSAGASGGSSAPAPPPAQYDLSTDPVLQQVMAAMGQADAQARAQALSQQQQALLAYGDPVLAASVLGANDPMVQAAAQNPESTVAQLLRAYQQNLQTFESGLDPSLAYSGYRVKQEGLLGQQRQDALASAAANVQNQLEQIKAGLNQSLASDQSTLEQAYSDAYTRAIEQALAAQTAGG